MPIAEWNPESYYTAAQVRAANIPLYKKGLTGIYVSDFEIGLSYPDSVVQSIYTGDTHSTRIGQAKWRGTVTIHPKPNPSTNEFDYDINASFQDVIQQLADPNAFFRLKFPTSYPKHGLNTPVRVFWSTQSDPAGRGNFARLAGSPINVWRNPNNRPVDGMYVTNGHRVWRIHGLYYNNNRIQIRSFIPDDELPTKTLFIGNNPHRFYPIWWAEYIYARPIRNREGSGPMIQQVPGDNRFGLRQGVTMAWEEVQLDTLLLGDITVTTS